MSDVPTPRGRDPVRSLVFRLTAVTVAVLLSLSVLASWSALRSFERVFFPELARKATTVGEILVGKIDRALNYGIPLGDLPGLTEVLTREVKDHPDLAYAVVIAPDGRRIAGVAASSLTLPERAPADAAPLVEGHQEVVLPLATRGGAVAGAALRLGIDPAHLARASVDLMLEVASELLVSVLITFEILLLVVHLSLSRVHALRHTVAMAEKGDFRHRPPIGPGRLGEISRVCVEVLDGVNARHAALAERIERVGKSASEGWRRFGRRFRFLQPGASPAPGAVNLVFLRLPIFLFCLSEELSRPFMPAYAATFAPSAPWLSPDLVVSLPITLFMLVWALSQPVGARMSSRLGRRQAFTGGAVIAAVGLLMTAHAVTLMDLLAWRCLTALGYGVVLITAQGIVIDHTTSRDRASGLALFLGGLLAAGVCGPVTGGIIADQVGFRSTFLVGAGLAILSGLALTVLFGRLIDRNEDDEAPATAVARLTDGGAWALLRNLRFIGLMALSAIPTKIAATGVLFCLVPLFLAEGGASKAEVGRVQMMYFIAFILISPIAASLSDRWQSRRGFIVLGGLGTLASAIPILLSDAAWAAPLAIALFGVSQSFIGAPQLTLVTQIAARSGIAETLAIGWYRMLERMGGAAGPLLAIALAVTYSYKESMLGISILCGVSALLFWILFRPEKSPAPVAAPRTTETEP